MTNITTSNLIFTKTNKKYNYFRVSCSVTTIDNLVNFVFSNIKKEVLPQYLSVNVQVEGEKGEFFTIGERYPIDIMDSESIERFNDFLLNNYDHLSDQYKSPTIIYYYLNYITLSKEEYIHKVDRIRNMEAKVEITLDNETPLNLPLNTDYSNWGSKIDRDESGNLIVKNLFKVNKIQNSKVKTIRVKFNGSISRTIDLICNDTVIKSINDRIISSNEFVRSFDLKEYYIRNNTPYFFFENKFPHKNITPLKINKDFNLDFMTLDIETYLDSEKIMNVYCISFYDGEKSKSFYIKDYENIESMILDLFKSLFIAKNHGKLIYIHNSSMFDLIFLLKPLLNYPNVKLDPIIKDGKFINLNIKYGNKGIYQINLRDSILLLPNSLAKLCSAFNVETPKDIFPHNFVNINSLDYVGSVPDYSFFESSKISIPQYEEYKKRFLNEQWDIKKEVIKYCELDCVSLHKVISNFSILIFEMFNINISKCPTLPSLAFKIFRTHYMDKNLKLPILINDIFKDINKSYYGGHVDMYIPENTKGEELFVYDVNSLYPFVMKNFKFPITLLGHFKGDISQKSEFKTLFTGKDNVGFYKVELISPSINHPIIPTKSNSGRTIFPEGNITGWYYSEELKNATKLGYSYNILEGYIFNSKNIFSEFVDKLSEMKEGADKNSATYLIAKLLMNSLYGKFGQKPFNIEHTYVDESKFDSFLEKIGKDNYINHVPMGQSLLVSHYIPFDNKTAKINVAIASAVTSYARIYMSIFKNNPDFNLYYSDTDSIIINRELSSDKVDSKKLGFMKLEYKLKNFVSLGAKVYGGIKENGDEFTKVKGFKESVSFEQLKSLLDKNEQLKLVHQKWQRSVRGSFIQIKDSPYDLKILSTKRQAIFDNNGKLIGTSNIVNGKNE